MIGNWTRSEASKLTNLSRAHLEYLEKNQLILPTRTGVKPAILYSWRQIIILKIYTKLRQECSLQALRDAFKYLNQSHEQTLISKRLVAYENIIYCIDDSKDDLWQVVTVSDQDKGQMVATFAMIEILDELKQVGKSNIFNFEQRFEECYKVG